MEITSNATGKEFGASALLPINFTPRQLSAFFTSLAFCCEKVHEQLELAARMKAHAEDTL